MTRIFTLSLLALTLLPASASAAEKTLQPSSLSQLGVTLASLAVCAAPILVFGPRKGRA